MSSFSSSSASPSLSSCPDPGSGSLTWFTADVAEAASLFFLLASRAAIVTSSPKRRRLNALCDTQVSHAQKDGSPVKYVPFCFFVDHERDRDVRFPERQHEIARKTTKSTLVGAIGDKKGSLTSYRQTATQESARRDFQSLAALSAPFRCTHMYLKSLTSRFDRRLERFLKRRTQRIIRLQQHPQRCEICRHDRRGVNVR